MANTPRSEALVTPGLLSWARLRADMSVSQLAKKLSVTAEKVLAWESGDKRPTFNQAVRLAEVTNIPFGFLYLQRPPVENLPIPDLRTVGSIELKRLSLNLRDVVRDAIAKQDWLIEYLRSNDEASPLSFVGKFDEKARITEVASDMKRVLQVEKKPKGNGDQYFTFLVRAAEAKRILVLRSGVVGSNTHRKLDVHEFRGFSIVNKIVPVIFINSADAPTARLFTLAHELAHIWIGKSGISDTAIKSSNATERVCNAIAGEFLVPATEFKNKWNKEADWESEVRRIAPTFQVSKLVIARRAKDLNLIEADQYHAFYESDLKNYKQKNASKEGGDPYRTTAARNGAFLTRLVLNEALSGQMLLRDASGLLGVQPSKLPILAKKIAA